MFIVESMTAMRKALLCVVLTLAFSANVNAQPKDNKDNNETVVSFGEARHLAYCLGVQESLNEFNSKLLESIPWSDIYRKNEEERLTNEVQLQKVKRYLLVISKFLSDDQNELLIATKKMGAADRAECFFGKGKEVHQACERWNQCSDEK